MHSGLDLKHFISEARLEFSDQEAERERKGFVLDPRSHANHVGIQMWAVVSRNVRVSESYYYSGCYAILLLSPKASLLTSCIDNPTPCTED